MKIVANLLIGHLINYLSRIAILRLKQWCERAYAPFTHVSHRLRDSLHVRFLLLVGLIITVFDKVGKECESGVSNVVWVVCLVYDGQLIDDSRPSFADYGCKALEGPNSQLFFGQ